MISARRGSLAPRYHDLLPTQPIERTADVERPDVVQRLQPVSATENPDFVLVEHRGVRAARRGNVRGHEGRMRPAASWDVEDVDAVVVCCALATADDDDLASYQSRGVRAAWRW